jgi:crossover junction endodeoxyribonuclease RusA
MTRLRDGRRAGPSLSSKQYPSAASIALDAIGPHLTLPLGQVWPADQLELAAADVDPAEKHEGLQHPESVADILDKTMPTTITVALPPSVNRLWRTWRGRVVCSKTYAARRETAGSELLTQRPKRIAGPVSVTIVAGRPDRRRRDIDNLGKAVLDLLVAHQVIADDSLVVSLASSWDTTITPGRVTVSIAPAT